MKDLLLLLGFLAFYGLSMENERSKRQELLDTIKTQFTELQQCKLERIKR